MSDDEPDYEAQRDVLVELLAAIRDKAKNTDEPSALRGYILGITNALHAPDIVGAANAIRVS